MAYAIILKYKLIEFLGVNVFSTKALIGDTICYFLTGDETAILRGHLSHRRFTRLQGKGSTFISQLFLRP